MTEEKASSFFSGACVEAFGNYIWRPGHSSDFISRTSCTVCLGVCCLLEANCWVFGIAQYVCVSVTDDSPPQPVSHTYTHSSPVACLQKSRLPARCTRPALDWFHGLPWPWSLCSPQPDSAWSPGNNLRPRLWPSFACWFHSVCPITYIKWLVNSLLHLFQSWTLLDVPSKHINLSFGILALSSCHERHALLE